MQVINLILLASAALFCAALADETCSFVFYADSSQYEFANDYVAFDTTNYYLVEGQTSTVTVFDGSMNIVKSITVANTRLYGVVLFSTNDKAWLYGKNTNLNAAVLFVVDSSLNFVADAIIT